MRINWKAGALAFAAVIGYGLGFLAGSTSGEQDATKHAAQTFNRKICRGAGMVLAYDDGSVHVDCGALSIVFTARPTALADGDAD